MYVYSTRCPVQTGSFWIISLGTSGAFLGHWFCDLIFWFLLTFAHGYVLIPCSEGKTISLTSARKIPEIKNENAFVNFTCCSAIF